MSKIAGLTIGAEACPVGAHAVVPASVVTGPDVAEVAGPAVLARAPPGLAGAVRAAVQVAAFWKNKCVKFSLHISACIFYATLCTSKMQLQKNMISK